MLDRRDEFAAHFPMKMPEVIESLVAMGIPVNNLSFQQFMEHWAILAYGYADAMIEIAETSKPE